MKATQLLNSALPWRQIATLIILFEIISITKTRKQFNYQNV